MGEPNEKGDKPIIMFDKNGQLMYLKALNKDNKAYLNKDKAKDILKETTVEGNETRLRNTARCKNYEMLRFIPLNYETLEWNEEKHAFVLSED